MPPPRPRFLLFAATSYQYPLTFEPLALAANRIHSQIVFDGESGVPLSHVEQAQTPRTVWKVFIDS